MRKAAIVSLALCSISVALAQAQGPVPPPKVLAIYREYLKPGKSGTLHEKTEAAFVQAVERAKWPEHYLAVNSLTGPTRALFLFGYESLEAWENDMQATEKNTAFAAALDRAGIADGELLSSTDAATFLYREDLSFAAPLSIAEMRYFSIVDVHVRPGHSSEFEEMIKLWNDARTKAKVDVHLAVYQIYAGGSSLLTYLNFAPLKSLAGLEARNAANAKAVDDALGEEGRKKRDSLMASSVESVDRQLFIFSPKMSYPPEAWVTADPDFWKPKPSKAAAVTAPGAKKENAKPSGD